MLEIIESEGDHWYGIITGQEKPINEKKIKKINMNDNFTEHTTKNKKKYATWQLHRSCRVSFNVNMQIEGGVKITCPLRSGFIYNMNSSDHKHPHSIIASYI